jgi:predicted transcriptional regulator
MADVPHSASGRHSIIELAPLELDCMNALWPLGEATVRDIQEALVQIRPRAYTTIMTIMDRLARKGTVVRRKTGRAWVYRPNLSADEARASAVSRVIDGFFDGSSDALAVHISGRGAVWSAPSPVARTHAEHLREDAAEVPPAKRARPAPSPKSSTASISADAPEAAEHTPPPQAPVLDTSLL